MQEPKDTYLPPSIPPARRRTTSATLFRANSAQVVEDDENQELGYRNVPYKTFVDTLSLPSTIGTAIAASAAFTILSTDSILEDNSPQSLAQRREMVITLAWSAGLFAIATAITVCLQALYGSPSFCKVLSKKLNYKPDRREKFKRWPSWDFMRYVVAYTAVVGAYLALVLHLAATILIIGIFKPYAPTLIAQIIMVLVFILGILGWTISVALEQRRAREHWRKLLRLPAAVAAPASLEQLTVQEPQVEPKMLLEGSSHGKRNAST
ncbi:hypothetical protein M407DRAFT_221013 [Tulasnella calospora MUT 4182]|uniref:Uncharacterized protein n=1 Tax=Tulasnella calospora MUT 4182 TaxID=1051891 RepID=A0A0C3QSY9_9AGAM|nr:hypothetical protein M407DRAFT_221013 [Tulasnella calospora MUT 4182]